MLSLVVIAIAIAGSLYCLSTRKYGKALIMFFIYTSCIDGPLKIMTWRTTIKLLVYATRDIFLYILFFRAIMSGYFSKERKLQKLPSPPYAALVKIYFFSCALQIFNPGGYNLFNSLAGLRVHIEMIPLFFFGYYLMNSKQQFRKLFFAIIFCASLNAIASFIQAVKGMDWLASLHPGYSAWMFELRRFFRSSSGEMILRAPGLGSDMGFAGFYAVFTFPLLLILFMLRDKMSANARFFLIGLFVLLVVGVFSSSARSAYVLSAIAILLAIYFLSASRNIHRLVTVIPVIAVLLSLGLWFMYTRYPHLTERFETVKTMGKTIDTIAAEEGRVYGATGVVIDYSRDYFFGNGLGKLGPGAGLFAKDASPSTLYGENQLSLAIAETGVPGALFLFLIHLSTFLCGKKWYKKIKDKESRLYLAAPLIIMALLFVYWPFGNLISFPTNAAFWFCAGVLVRFKTYAQEEGQLL